MAVQKFERDLNTLIVRHCRSNTDRDKVEREEVIEIFREIQAFRELEGLDKSIKERRSVSPLQPG